MAREIFEVRGREELYLRVIESIKTAGIEAVGNHGRFTLVLTGGRTIQPLYQHLVDCYDNPEFHDILDKTDFFLSDERWVTGDHVESNGGMVSRLLFAPLSISADRTFLIPYQDISASPEESAADYEKNLRNYFSNKLSGGSRFPEFDLLLLSMGDDGHIASLFPGAEALEVKKLWVAVTFPPAGMAPQFARVTVTLPVINRAKQVIIMALGEKKTELARKIIAEPVGANPGFPAGMVKSEGRTIWLLADN